jgi:hypothetical protein
VDGKKTRFQELKDRRFRIHLADGSMIEATGDEVIRLPNGRLSTVYHLLLELEHGQSQETEPLVRVPVHQN